MPVWRGIPLECVEGLDRVPPPCLMRVPERAAQTKRVVFPEGASCQTPVSCASKNSQIEPSIFCRELCIFSPF